MIASATLSNSHCCIHNYWLIDEDYDYDIMAQFLPSNNKDNIIINYHDFLFFNNLFINSTNNENIIKNVQEIE
jgi:hypothetical protein